MKKNHFKKLIISGGGIKGISICGVLEWLQENTKILDSINEIYGQSLVDVDASNLKTGLYFVNLTFDHNTYTKRISIE